MDRSTRSETATKTVNTVATDQVGVNAKDLRSFPLSETSEDFDSDILLTQPQTSIKLQPSNLIINGGVSFRRESKAPL